MSAALALTMEEAAQELRVSVRTIKRLVRNGELLVRRVGRRVLVPRTAIETFFKKDHTTQYG